MDLRTRLVMLNRMGKVRVGNIALLVGGQWEFR
jgi:hypothetical protein